MNNINVVERFELGPNKPMNERLNYRLSIIRDMLSVLDMEGVEAEILLIADTTSFAGTLKWEVTCKQKEFKRLINRSFKQFVEDF